MGWPIADERQLFVATQWIITFFAWDDMFDIPEEENLMTDAMGAAEINDRIMAVLDHSETSKTQDIPVVTAFREYVDSLTP